MNKVNFLGLASLLIVLSPSLNAAEAGSSQWLSPWEMKGAGDGIQAVCRQHKTKINQCKITKVFDASLTALTAVITDVENFKSWAISVMQSDRIFPSNVLPSTASSSNLLSSGARPSKIPQPSSLEDIYVYTTYHFTGAYNRDAISRYTFDQNPETKVVRITFKTVDIPLPKVDLRLVRFPLMAGYWQFAPLKNGKTQVELMSFALPGGIVQKTLYYLYNTANLEASFDTIRALMAEVKKAKYQNASLSFVDESSADEPNVDKSLMTKGPLAALRR